MLAIDAEIRQWNRWRALEFVPVSREHISAAL